MSDISRRQIAKGSIWAVPTIAVGAAAPALAASPCAGIVKNQPLPASAFTLVYLNVTNQTFGGAANKQITVAAGVKINPAVLACIGNASLTMSSSTNTSRLVLTNGTTYNVATGTESNGTGTAGTTNTGCTGGDNTAQACITQAGMSVANSTGTSTNNPSKLSFSQTVTVQGYGATTLYFNANSYSQSGTNWLGGGLSITSGPLF